MEITGNRKSLVYQAVFLLIAVLFCTWLRVGLLFLYPLVVLFIFYLCNWKLSINGIYILLWVAFCWLFSFRHGVYLKYNLLSFFYFIPFFALLFARPSPAKSYLHLLMNALTFVAVLNDIPGIIQYLLKPNDDSFVGIYGSFTVSQNGLSIVNAILFFYYFVRFQHHRGAINLALLCFFLFCSVMGFYGAGLMALILAFALSYLKVSAKDILKLVLIITLLLGILILAMRAVSPKTLEYNTEVIKLFLKPSSPSAPRKIVAFLNYFNGYPRNILDFLFGSGPGTFNSRSAFMVGSPTYFNVEAIKSIAQPYYFQQYAYPLWNYTNTGPYDGFMNQPFSSLLALLGEYGLLLTLLIVAVHGKKFLTFKKFTEAVSKKTGTQAEARLYQFCCWYAVLLIIIDNYIEYPEVIALLVIIIKLTRQKIEYAASAV